MTDQLRLFRRDSDPTTAHAGAVEVLRREGAKGQIRRGSGRHMALAALADHPEGISGYEAGRYMADRWGYGRTSKSDPADIGRRRVNEVWRLGAADREDELYVPNATTERALALLAVGEVWRP